MFVVTIDTELCEGCGDCVDTCPSELISLVEQNGVKVATYSGDPDECLACYSCESTCPQGSITVTES